MGPLTQPTFEGVATARAFSATNVVGAITGCQVGDILIAFGGGNDQTTSLTPPAGLGWTQLADTGGTVAARSYVFATTATSADQAGGTWTWAGSHNHEIKIVAYRAAVLPTTASAVKVANLTTVDAPSQTSAHAKAMLVVSSFYATNGTAPAWPVSMTVRSTNTGASASGIVAEELLPTAGASGVRTFSAGGTPSAMAALSVLLEAA